MGVFYLGMVIRNFPYHLITVLLCFASIIWMSLFIQKSKKHRLIAIILPFVCTALICIAARVLGLTIF